MMNNIFIKNTYLVKLIYFSKKYLNTLFNFHIKSKINGIAERVNQILLHGHI
jgi:hypothetical protein